MKAEGPKFLPSSFCHLILVEPAGQLREQTRVLNEITPRYIRWNAVITAGKVSAFSDERSHPHYFDAHRLATSRKRALVNPAAKRNPAAVLFSIRDDVVARGNFERPSVIETAFDKQRNEFGDIPIRVN